LALNHKKLRIGTPISKKPKRTACSITPQRLVAGSKKTLKHLPTFCNIIKATNIIQGILRVIMSPAATHNTFAKRKYPGVPLQMYCGLHFQKICKKYFFLNQPCASKVDVFKVPNEVQFGELYFSFFYICTCV
jgi:hypothetical protein